MKDIAAVCRAYGLRAHDGAGLSKHGVHQVVVYGSDGQVIYGWERSWKTGKWHPWEPLRSDPLAWQMVDQSSTPRRDHDAIKYLKPKPVKPPKRWALVKAHLSSAAQSSLVGGDIPHAMMPTDTPFWLMDAMPD
jgi:hypothetical protein